MALFINEISLDTTKEEFCALAHKDSEIMVTGILEEFPEIQTLSHKDLEVWLEVNFSKQEKVQWVEKKIFSAHLEVIAQYCEEHELNFKDVARACALVALHRRVDISTLANQMKRRFKDGEETLEFLKKLVEEDFVKYENGIFMPQSSFSLTPKDEIILDCFQSNPPMVYRPNKVRGRKKLRNGYLNINRSVWSKGAKVHTEVPVDFLDTQNEIPYKINYRVWDGWIKYNPEIPERGDEDDDVYLRKLKEAYRHFYKKCFFVEFYRSLGIDTIYILNFFDKRGRNYPVSYLFNPQGRDPDKALLSFPSQLLTKEGLYWLKVSIANNFNCKYLGKDLDKLQFEQRIQWFSEVVEPMMSLSPIEFYTKLESMSAEAESPSCFWSQMDNLYQIYQDVKAGKAPMSWCITHFDATASGYQLQALFARDRKMLKLTNVIGNERTDLYTNLYQELITKGMPSTFTRLQVKKKAFIPAVYNSSRSIKELFKENEYIKLFLSVMGKYPMWQMNRMFPDIWDQNWTHYSWLLPDGFRVQVELSEIQDEILEFGNTKVTLHNRVIQPQEQSRELGPNATHSCDGFIARELSRRMSWNPYWKRWIRGLKDKKYPWINDPEHESCKVMRELLDLGKEFNMYSMRILREITPRNIGMIPDELFERLYSELPENPCFISEIHDSFGVPPNYAGELMQQYRYILRDVSQSRFLQTIIYQLLGTVPAHFIFKEDKALADDIMQSVYALC